MHSKIVEELGGENELRGPVLTTILKKSLKSGLISFGVILLFGCQKTPSDWNPNEGFKTQIVAAHSDGNQFQVVELQGVQDMHTLNGLVAEFFFAPGEKGDQVKGQAPVARFVKNSKGVYIPADVLSLQMVTLYYHLQQLKNLELSVRKDGVVTWPRKVGIKVKAANPLVRFDNAFYSSDTDMLYFVPYKGNQTPIPLNGGVIAHELFHSYFAFEVLNKLKDQKTLAKSRKAQLSSDDELEEAVTLDYYNKSVNEGLADFWGWIHSEDPNFVGLSLPEESRWRDLEKASLDFLQRKLIGDKNLKEQAAGFTQCHLGGSGRSIECPCERGRLASSPFYCAAMSGYWNGTILAQTLLSFASARRSQAGLSREEIKVLMAEKIFLLLDKIRQRMDEKNFSLEQVVLDWAGLFDDLKSQECRVLQSSVTSPDAKGKVCAGK